MRHLIIIIFIFTLHGCGFFLTNDFNLIKPDYFELSTNGKIIKISDSKLYFDLCNTLEKVNDVISHTRYSTFTENHVDRTSSYLILVYNTRLESEHSFNQQLVYTNNGKFIYLNPVSIKKKIIYNRAIIPLKQSGTYDSIIFTNDNGSEQIVIYMGTFISTKFNEILEKSK